MMSNSAKKKQNKQIKQLCILVIVLVVLLVIFLVARYLNNQAELAEEEAENATIDVTYLSEDATPTTLVISNDEGDTTYVYDADSDEWSWEEDADFPLNNNYITALLNTWDSLDSDTELEITDELSAYGLDPAELSATVSTDDGESLTVLVGIATGDYYYCMIDGEDKIYLISDTLPSYLDYNLYDMASLETFPTLSSSNIETITIEGTVETSFYQESVETETTDDDGETTTTTEECWYTTDGEDVTEADYISELTSEVIGLSLSSMVNYYTTDEDLADAGLDEPQCVLTVEYTETDEDDNETTESFTLEIGDLNEDEDSYYVLYDGGTTIYEMDSSDIDTLISVAESGSDALYLEDEDEDEEDE